MSALDKCPDCHSTFSRPVAVCDACGCQVWRVRVATRRTARWKYRVAAVMTGVGVAVVNYLVQQHR
ncbi:MAG TPA: hypothetical protein VGN17_19780 [Bryobacteraceae bacterium]